MARVEPTLAEVSLRQQVRAANRVAFWRLFHDGHLPSLYWLGVSALTVFAGVLAWRFFA